MAVRVLSKELQEKAINELNEIPEQVHEHLHELKEWLSTQDHIKNKMADQWLLSFLRGCKFDIQKTKSKLKFFNVMREKAPEFFNNRDPLLPEIQDILKRGVILPIQNVFDPTGPSIMIVRWEKVNYRKDLLSDLLKIALMYIDIFINESDSFIIAGQQVVYDFSGFSLSFVTQLTPSILKNGLACAEKAYPTRIKGMYFANAPVYFRLIYNLFYPFMSNKLRTRVKVYGSDAFQENNIYKDVHPSLLPKEYGGDGGSADEIASIWKEKIESYRDWFLDDTYSLTVQI